MLVVPYRPEHLTLMRVQPAQAYMRPFIEVGDYADALAASPAYTGMIGEQPVVCAGIILQWEGRAFAWALVSEDCCAHLFAATRAVARFLALRDERRIETTVRSDFAEGARWARMLGFEREGKMRAYSPDGRDYDLYARIR